MERDFLVDQPASSIGAPTCYNTPWELAIAGEKQKRHSLEKRNHHVRLSSTGTRPG